MKITNEDRKHAHNFLTLVKRNAYGGNLMTAEGALARMLAEERGRIADQLQTLLSRSGPMADLCAFIRELRGDEEESAGMTVTHPTNESGIQIVSSPPSESTGETAPSPLNESRRGDSNKVLE